MRARNLQVGATFESFLQSIVNELHVALQLLNEAALYETAVRGQTRGVSLSATTTPIDSGSSTGHALSK
jgi:hypothetical protein